MLKGVPYKEINVREKPLIAEEMFKKIGMKAVPIVVIGNDVIIGFDKNKIEESLKKNEKTN